MTWSFKRNLTPDVLQGEKCEIYVPFAHALPYCGPERPYYKCEVRQPRAPACYAIQLTLLCIGLRLRPLSEYRWLSFVTRFFEQQCGDCQLSSDCSIILAPLFEEEIRDIQNIPPTFTAT
jgi:hypothetical protein